MSADVFLDTNVFVQHLDTIDPAKHAVAESLVRGALTEGKACISYHVVQQCLNVVVLLSEDLQSGQRIEGLTIRNPFA